MPNETAEWVRAEWSRIMDEFLRGEIDEEAFGFRAAWSLASACSVAAERDEKLSEAGHGRTLAQGVAATRRAMRRLLKRVYEGARVLTGRTLLTEQKAAAICALDAVHIQWLKRQKGQ